MIMELLQSLGLLTGYLTQNTFPQPLSEEEERHYLQQLTEGSQEAKDTLIRHNLRLVAHIAKKFDYGHDEQDDLISIGTIGLIKGINTFNPQKNVKLATYAARCIENEILMYLRVQKKRKNEVSLNESIGVDHDGNNISLRDVLGTDGDLVVETVELAFEYATLVEKLQCLSDRERLVISMRFGLLTGIPATQKEIGEHLGISRSYVSRIEKKALMKLKDEFERNGEERK